ncbi:MAG: hypothetical protein ACOX9C_02160 [Kiritimatiellia bacterium]|jgi:hypothetical protein
MNFRRLVPLALVVLACALHAQAQAPAPAPLHDEAPILSAADRKRLAKEMKELTAEIHAARKAAAEAPSLAPLKEALDAAKETTDAAKIQAAQRALADGVEALLYQQEGMPAKIKRLIDVGHLLRYDTPNQRKIRRQNRPVVHANPFPTADTNSPPAITNAP